MHFLRLILTIGILLAGLSSIQATDLQVHLQQGPQLDYPLEDIRSLVYNPTTSALEINFTAGGFTPYYLEEIRKLTFEAGHITEVVMPQTTDLMGNYPNPFNSTTRIEFELPADGEVLVAIYNIQGQLVQRLVDGFLPAGSHQFSWDGTSDASGPVASGVYICRVRQGEQQQLHRMLLLK
jgi:hypothetical protein